MEIESAHAHDVFDGHSTQGRQAMGGRSAGKIELAAYRNTPLEQERISDLMNIIPKGRESVLDVGERDGYLLRLLTEHFASVTALDLEKPSIAHDRITCVKGKTHAPGIRQRLFRRGPVRGSPGTHSRQGTGRGVP